MSDILVMRDLVGGYGDANVLQGVSMTAAKAEIVVIVGPNGAGNSTAMKAIFGLLKVRGGSITVDPEAHPTVHIEHEHEV